jgi:hypothetical protein
MGVETIEEAYMLGWRILVRCAWGRREAMKSVGACLAKAELDLHTLVGPEAPPSPSRALRTGSSVPLCGSRRVSIVFDLPKEPNAMRIARMPSS